MLLITVKYRQVVNIKRQGIRVKLAAAGLSLLIAIVMLVTASLAWFSLSTNPEIGGMQVSLYTGRALLMSETEDGIYTELLNLGEKFSRYVDLKPVSTADGINWFLPEYEASGQLKPVYDFTLDTTLYHANVSRFDETGKLLQDAELKAAYERGAYVYADIWFKTQEDRAEVRLSVPSRPANELDEWEQEQGSYGTYVLGTYKKQDASTMVLDTEAQAAMRVGFLVGEGTENQKFIIYEPNADQRSALTKPNDITYVLGYEKNNLNYQNNFYIPTRPIEIGEDGKGKISDISINNLIIQLQCQWNMVKLQETLLSEKRPSSNDVMTMGRFITDKAALYEALDEESNMAAIDDEIPTAIAGEPVILSLVKDIPQKVRMFIWIEGQDVDCWNDIAAGSFVVNLEFAADTD